MYLFYIDESGNLDTNVVETNSDGTTSYKPNWLYALTAVGFYEHNWKRFYYPIIYRKRELMHKIKSVHGENLSIEHCEVKSHWMRTPDKREKSKFLSRLTTEEITELASLYYNSLNRFKMNIVSVVIDKRYLTHTMDSNQLHNKAWELLCEQINNYMCEKHPKHKAILVVDDIGKQQNAHLTAKHTNLLHSSTNANPILKYIVEMPMFVKSEFSEGIQLADLCSYNVYRAFVNSDIEYEFFKKIQPHFYVSKHTDSKIVDGLEIFPPESPLNELAKKVTPMPRARG